MTVFVVIVAAWAVTLRPVTLGGPAAYVIVDGISMEPTYEDRDLVITRKTGHYVRGDVIAYHPSTAITDRAHLTIHRIIGRNAAGDYLTQGDNRSEPDQWVARPEQIQGETWIHVPRVGAAILWLREPLHFRFLIAGFLAVSLVGGKRKVVDRRRYRFDSDGNVTRTRKFEQGSMRPNLIGGVMLTGIMFFETIRNRLKTLGGRNPMADPGDRGTPGASPFRRKAPPPRSGGRIVLAAVLVVVLVVSTYMSVLGFRNSEHVEVETVALQHEHLGNFQYTVAMEPSTLYPDGVIGPISAPEAEAGVGVAETDAAMSDEEPAGPPPIYVKIARTFTLDFSYELLADDVEEITGTYRALLTIRAGSDGWDTERELVPPTEFMGTALDFEMVVDLQALSAELLQVEEETGFRPAEYYIALQPEIQLHGIAGEQMLLDTFRPVFTLNMDAVEIETGNEFEQHEIRTTTTSEQVANVLNLPGGQVGVARARTLGSLGIAVAIVGLAGLGYLSVQRLLGNEDEMIRVRHGSILVSVDSDDVSSSDRGRIRVASIEDLVRIAEREGQIIFQHEYEPGTYRYFVRDGSATYEYSRAAGAINNDSDGSGRVGGRGVAPMGWAVDDLPGLDD
ncbi:MAG: DUF5305 family protein [Thermomicrobiales bacterium]